MNPMAPRVPDAANTSRRMRQNRRPRDWAHFSRTTVGEGLCAEIVTLAQSGVGAAAAANGSRMFFACEAPGHIYTTRGSLPGQQAATCSGDYFAHLLFSGWKRAGRELLTCTIRSGLAFVKIGGNNIAIRIDKASAPWGTA